MTRAEAIEPKDAEPVAWAIYLNNELVDLSLSEPEYSNDYSWIPLYTDPRRAEVVARIEEYMDAGVSGDTYILLADIRDYLEGE